VIIGVRDPLGVRPLVLGRLGDAWILSSETCALYIIGAEFVRDIAAGEIVIIGAKGIDSLLPFGRRESRFCVFEHIYFARPDSIVEGTSVYEARKRIGRELARESHVDADIIVPVPDSGVPAALGYSQESGLPFELGIIRAPIW
jgi:amidophosphoribosyltransferase